MQYHFKIHKEKDCYWGDCIELKGCHSQGETLDELSKNLKEALNLYLDEFHNTDIINPLPSIMKKQQNMASIEVEPQIAFSVLLRYYRKKHNLTQDEVAARLGMKNIYRYQRLERRANPSLNTIKKIKDVFPEFSIDAIV